MNSDISNVREVHQLMFHISHVHGQNLMIAHIVLTL